MNKSGAAKAKATAAVKIQDAEIQMAWAQADTEMAIEAKDVAEQAAAKAKAGLLARVLG